MACVMYLFRKTKLIVLLVVILVQLTFAASITAVLSPAFLQVGDSARYIVEAKYPTDAHAELSIGADSTLGQFAIRAFTDTSFNDGNAVRHIELTLLHMGISDWVLPPAALLVVYAQGNAETLVTQPMRVSFSTLLANAPLDSLDIRDLAAPVAFPFDFKSLTRNCALALLTFLIMLASFWFVHIRRRGIGVLEFIAPKKDPWDLAIMRLEALAESDLLDKKEYKEYFDKLTDILREYIENRFGITALELSTTETMENLCDAHLDVNESVAEKFVENTELLLRRADMVKFAKHLPDLKLAHSDLQLIRALVEQTIPAPSPTSEAEDSSQPTANK